MEYKKLEIVDMVSEDSLALGKLTLSPSEERVTLKLAHNLDEPMIRALIDNARHLARFYFGSVTVRGKFMLNGGQIEITLYSDSGRPMYSGGSYYDPEDYMR